MISNKLISDVLGKDVIVYEGNTSLNPDGNMVVYGKPRSFGQTVRVGTINTNELVHKCKVKALEYGYEIVEEKNQVKIFDGNKRRARFIGDIKENYKPSRVFDSYEWILDNK